MTSNSKLIALNTGDAALNETVNPAAVPSIPPVHTAVDGSYNYPPAGASYNDSWPELYHSEPKHKLHFNYMLI